MRSRSAAAAAAGLNGGLIYAPAALLNLSGSAQLGSNKQPAGTLVVNQLLFTGTGSSALAKGDGTTSAKADVVGQLLAGDVSVYVDQAQGGFTPDQLARIMDAVNSANATVAPYGVHVTEAADPRFATTVITTAPAATFGDAGNGLLGIETPGGITFVSGWAWYDGTDPSRVGTGQYDFETIVLHELGHTLGLGHSADANSVMYATLDAGAVKRSLVSADLNIPDADSGPNGLHAAASPSAVSVTPAASPAVTILIGPPSVLIETPAGMFPGIRSAHFRARGHARPTAATRSIPVFQTDSGHRAAPLDGGLAHVLALTQMLAEDHHPGRRGFRRR